MALHIACGLLGGAALALVQYALTRRLAAFVLSSRRGGAKLLLALKLPISLAAVALIALVSPYAAVSAAAGYTICAFAGAILAYKRKGE